MSLLLLGVLFLASGFFSSAETALFSLTKLEKRRFTEKHPKISKFVLRHLDSPRKTLMTILIGNMTVNTLSASFATLLAIKTFGIAGLGWAMAAFTLVLIIVGEIIPKVLAVRQNEVMATLFSPLLQVFVILFAPLRFVVKHAADWVMSFMVRDKKSHGETFTESELRALVDVGEEEGVLEPQESYMIQKLFALGERPVKDIMIPRIDVKGLNIEDNVQEHIELIRRHHFAYFPVFEENLDHILGVVAAQEYVLNPKKDLRSFMTQPLFVPETKRMDELLEEFKLKKVTFAVCVDEHGGTAGIATQEDVLEEIFGEYYDEYEIVKNPIRKFAHQEYLVEAKVSLADFNEYFSCDLNADDSSTLGGYILEKLGKLPHKGDVLDVPGFQMVIRDVIRRRIRHVMVKTLSNLSETTEEKAL